MSQPDASKERLQELLAYVYHLGCLNQKPAFTVAEYKQLVFAEHQLKARVGIHHDVSDDDGNGIWLQVERLKRIPPPPLPEAIKAWVCVNNNPNDSAIVKEKIVNNLPDFEAERLITDGTVPAKDVQEPLWKHEGIVKRKDVTIRLDNLPEIKAKINAYIQKAWYPWAQAEKPRRETIRIYDALFSLQQSIDAQGEEQAVELVWGIGVCRWLVANHQIDHPLLEQRVEIEVERDGTLSIRPSNVEPNIAVQPYTALGILGVDALIRLTQQHFAELSDDVEFTPFNPESFEPILKQAATRLSEGGVYWPDVNPKRDPPRITDKLCVSDSWVIYGRPRSVTSWMQDVERFQKHLDEHAEAKISAPVKRLVSELSDEKPGSNINGAWHAASTGSQGELYFPKAYNESQVQIIDRLERNDGVVVQGPPGTGKTHTIANIISHYLATGRTVLVTSKGKQALDVLREQIPEDLRGLTISLLSNERESFDQLQQAVRMLAGIAGQTTMRDLKREAQAHAQRVGQLKRQITLIDREIHEWAGKQLQTINPELTGGDPRVTAMDLAQQVVSQGNRHDWLPDALGFGDDFKPRFTDADIDEIRLARQVLGQAITYVDKKLPDMADLPKAAHIGAIHTDLVAVARIGRQAQADKLPSLTLTVENAVERAKTLLSQLQRLLTLMDDFRQNTWARQLYTHWLDQGLGHQKVALFEELLPILNDLVTQRQVFLHTPVNMEDPIGCRADIDTALEHLGQGRKAFGLFHFGKSRAKSILNKVQVLGEKPNTIEQWQHVQSFLNFQDQGRRFIQQWNSLVQEYQLPKLAFHFGESFKPLDNLHDHLHAAVLMATKTGSELCRELQTLFPHGFNSYALLTSQEEIQWAIRAIESQTSRLSLSAQKQQLTALQLKLRDYNGEIADKLNAVIAKGIGNAKYSADQLSKYWQGLLHELARLHKLAPDMLTVFVIAQMVRDSGAKIWADKLSTEAVFDNDDPWTPGHWFDSWCWKRQAAYIKSIDGRQRLRELAEQRVAWDKDLTHTLSELVKIKTHMGLRQSLTERVQSALVRFVAATQKVGKGTGKRAPRHRRDASRAMQECYDGVPCWIMPTWRISETLPSVFGSFDLVIIDEASQSDITALPAILRAKKLLVVGDDRQVSPTAAFLAEEKILQLKHQFLQSQPFSELLLPGSSIYDLARAAYPCQRVMLTEHFRCVEPIIRFSMQFYPEPLLPLRIPNASERMDPPLVDVYVKNGTRDERNKTNRAEAEAIVEEIKHLTSEPTFAKRSLGVISLVGPEQAKRVQELLWQELGEETYQNHQIACGDSAAFQGKEKDIIFLSMVVGPGQGSALTKDEYRQRFNVALSRARDRMYLYRSIDETDIKNENDLKFKVLHHFKDPMPRPNQPENLLKLCESDFERDVYKRLFALGYFVTPHVNVGQYTIDLVVEGENDHRLAIELDGDKYHSPEKWREDFMRQRTMERVGWTFWRCWGSSFYVNPDGCMADLAGKLRELGIEAVGGKVRDNVYTEFREYIKTGVVESAEINTELLDVQIET